MARKPAKIVPPPADLSELDKVVEAQEEGRLIPIVNYDGVSPLGFSIRIAGPDSSRAELARSKMQQELIARESIEPLTTEERHIQGQLYVARLVMGFEPKAMLDGRELQPNEDDALKLFKRFRWIYKQVDDVAGRRQDFLSAAASPSQKPSEGGTEG